MKDTKSEKRSVDGTQVLLCKLTEKEKAERAERIGALVAEMQSVEDERKTAAEKYKARISELQTQINVCAGHARVGEYRDVKIESLFDYRTGAVVTKRLDTDEVIAERAMTAAERQMHFPHFEKLQAPESVQ